jgi:hypothetical protein
VAEQRDPARYATTDGQPPAPGHEGYDSPAPKPIDPATGQHGAYWILSEEERARGFVRPVRCKYVHAKCGRETRMGRTLSETHAREPKFYNETMCVHCHRHYPVAEFTWSDDGQTVGS